MSDVRSFPISKVFSRKDSSQKKVDDHIVNKMQKLFPGMFKKDLVDPARCAVMAAVSNTGTYAFGAYDDPSVDGFKDLTVEGNSVEYLKWDWVNNAMEGVIKIHLKDAKNLRDADILWNGDSDPYVIFSAGGSCVRSATVRDNKHPVWNSTHYLFLRKQHVNPQSAKELKINCYDCDQEDSKGILKWVNKDDSLGSASLPIDRLKKEEQKFELVLSDPKSKQKIPATINFTTKFISVEEALNEMDKSIGTDTWIERRELHNVKKWQTLATMTEIGGLDAEKVAFIDAPSTGTQAWVHVNSVAKAVVVAFRGTEINRLKDVLADLNFIPTPLTATKRRDNKSILKHSQKYLDKKIRVHSGFQKAYDSVRDTILRIVYDLTGWSKDWTVMITGHSLGGALATLCAFEFENLTYHEPQDWRSMALRAITFDVSSKEQTPNFFMMNFGAPRVGNEAFVNVYNETVSESLRVINANDLIHFLPPMLYKHTKFEVLLKKCGEVNLNGLHFQSSRSRELKEQIANGEIKEADLVKRAFSGLSILQHLGPYYFELVEKAVRKFKEGLGEVEDLQKPEKTDHSKKRNKNSKRVKA